jgi:hypothetical protein
MRATVDQFRDRSFEAGLGITRKPFIAFLYWTLKTQMQYLFGDYRAANCAAQKAKPKPSREASVGDVAQLAGVAPITVSRVVQLGMIFSRLVCLQLF